MSRQTLQLLLVLLTIIPLSACGTSVVVPEDAGLGDAPSFDVDLGLNWADARGSEAGANGDAEVRADADAADARELDCYRESDCPRFEACAVPLPNSNVVNCVRGTSPETAVCRHQCIARCLVGPHTLINPDDPPGIVGGLVTPDCLDFDAGPGD